MCAGKDNFMPGVKLCSIIVPNLVGKVAEFEKHHPDIEFGWGYAKINITTHAIEGLSENDFILAAKIDNKFNV